MKNTIYIYYCILVSILLTIAQISWKYSFIRIGGINLSFEGMKKVLDPFILLGLLLYLIATFMWFKVLSYLPLSLAYPILSISYVLGYFAGILIFKEPLNITNLFGVLLIIAGVLLLTSNVR